MTTAFLLISLFFPRLTLLWYWLNAGWMPLNTTPFALDVFLSLFWPNFLIAYWCYENGVHPMWVVAHIIMGVAKLVSTGRTSQAAANRSSRSDDHASMRRRY